MKEHKNRMSNRGYRVLASAVVCVMALCAPAGAQAPDSLPAGPLTLEQALELAESRSESIAISRAGVQRAEGEQTRARSGRFPQLSAAVNYDRALMSEFEGIFETTDLDAGENDFGDLPFGRENTWRVSATLSQNLYSGGRLRALARVADAGRDAATLGVSTARGQLLFDVTQAYYDAALSDRLVRIAQATLEQAEATLRQTQAGFDAGTQPEFEVVRARVTKDSQTPLVIRQRANREVALLRLKQLLDLPQDFDLQLPDAFIDDQLPPPPIFAPRLVSLEASIAKVASGAASLTAPPEAVPGRTVVNEAAATLRLREASLQLTEAQRKPIRDAQLDLCAHRLSNERFPVVRS